MTVQAEQDSQEAASIQATLQHLSNGDWVTAKPAVGPLLLSSKFSLIVARTLYAFPRAPSGC